MYDLDLYKEFNKIEYDDMKLQLYHLLSTNIKEEKLYSFSRMQEDYDFDSKYEKIWTSFVDYVKLIKDGSITNDGNIITKNLKMKCPVPENINSAWQIFKEHLINKKIYTFEEIEGLEKSANKIINTISPDTSETGTIKGLVMGYVQSGKTNSIESIMTMAADYGFNVFIVLSGIIENLRKQNLNRFREDIEYAKNSNIHWEFIDQVTKTTPKAYNLINSNKKVVIVSLKNSKRLQNIINWLFNSGDASLKNAKVLVIDDEADQAGLNTKDVTNVERSKINKLITELIDDYTDRVGGMNYIGYTATPYGNFLNEAESIYPKDFIYMLPKSPKYIGAQEIFGASNMSGKKADGLDIVRSISDDDLDLLTMIENEDTTRIPKSLEDALCWFVCTLATFRYKKSNKPVTMLVHDNRKTYNHFNLSNSISNFLNNIDRKIFVEKCRSVYEYETRRFEKQDFYDVMSNYGRDVEPYVSFDLLVPYINEIMSYKFRFAKTFNDNIEYSKGINQVIDNSIISKLLDEEDQPRLIYPEKNSGIDYSLGFIVTGGDTLSRGLTLEGLTTTYFARKSDTVDTLMQMGRWFGYRIGYELLERVWMDTETKEKYDELTQVEIELRNDLSKYEIGISPSECGPAILNTYLTRVTSKSKMQSAVACDWDYSGASPQTILFDKDENIQKYNIDLTQKFIENFRFKSAYNSNSNLLVENVDFDKIDEYLRTFKFCAQSTFFNNIESFCDWISNSNIDILKKWNIILAGTGEVDSNGNVGKVVRSKLRNYDDKEYFNIKILRNTRDIVGDMDPSKYNINYSDETNIIASRDKYNVPQLIIYKIDGKGVPKPLSKYREPINMNVDIIGLYLYIPGVMKKDYTYSIHMDLSKKEAE